MAADGEVSCELKAESLFRHDLSRERIENRRVPRQEPLVLLLRKLARDERRELVKHRLRQLDCRLAEQGHYFAWRTRDGVSIAPKRSTLADYLREARDQGKGVWTNRGLREDSSHGSGGGLLRSKREHVFEERICGARRDACEPVTTTHVPKELQHRRAIADCCRLSSNAAAIACTPFGPALFNALAASWEGIGFASIAGSRAPRKRQRTSRDCSSPASARRRNTASRSSGALSPRSRDLAGGPFVGI